VEFLLDAAALDPTTIALAAARADVVRLVHSAALPTPAAVRALVSVLEDEIRAVGRDRAEVRVVLEVETVVAADEADAARRRTAVAYAEAFSGVTWSPSATWLVAPRDRVLRDAADLAARTGVDTVALALVGSSARHAGSLVR
jgi:alkanesulfonate monooxygenase SsuD/methylene tetrahydromethanopterin reductase-like flavin-dependent oxidoreductase (luciferase family)